LIKKYPRISTRGYYNLTNGKTLKQNKYFLYPKKFFDRLDNSKELTIVIHGLRNDNAGAVNKIQIAQRRLKQLGYAYPIVGFSYDSNTKGAHLLKSAKRALKTGQTIAQKNGRNLCHFLIDFKEQNPKAKIRLLGHSLGTQVILSTVEQLAKRKQKGILDAVYFFGASITEDVPSSPKYKKLFDYVVSSKIINYYAPTDEVLVWADKNEMVKRPLGLGGSAKKSIQKYKDRKVKPKNHRFASYAQALSSFP